MEGLCDICMPEAFCGFETVRQKVLLSLCALWEKKMSFVRDKTTQRDVCVSSHRVGAFYFSQKNTKKQNTQGFTETFSQPITQNVTANVSWKASVNSVCRRPSVSSKCAPKTSVNSVRSVREKPPQRVVCVLSHSEGAFSFSQMNTEEQSGQSLQKVLNPPPFPSPRSSRLQKGLDNISEHAFLARRTCPSCPKKGMFLKGTYNILISCRLQAWLMSMLPPCSKNKNLRFM